MSPLPAYCLPSFALSALLCVALSGVLAAPAGAADPPALPLPPIEYGAERVTKFDWVQIDSGESHDAR